MKKSILIFGLVFVATMAFAQTATQPAATQPAAQAAQPAAQTATSAATAQPTQSASSPASSSGPAPSNGSIDSPQASQIGISSAQQDLREISVDKFEDDGFWSAKMPQDIGIITLRRFEGHPADAKPVPGDVKESDKYVLGVKVQFLHRAVTEAEIIPVRPIPIPGITKTLSVWVVGRNVNNVLYAIVSDHFGNLAKIYLGNLAFTGWKKLTAAIPPNIRQSDPRYNDRQGLTFEKFLIEFDPAQTYGSYYIYFDDMNAMVDLFAEDNRDADDMNDSW
ncbi:MAG: flagellar filament protein FlaA [Spirochaetales bacterium]|nr:flagellar filament protein FlaA [Spirochaetales bacterium]